MKKKLLGAIALMTCFTSVFSMTACFGGGGDDSQSADGNNGTTIAVDPLTAADLGAGFNADYLPDKASIKQYSGKVDIALDFEGTVKGWEALAAEYERLQGGGVDINAWCPCRQRRGGYTSLPILPRVQSFCGESRCKARCSSERS